MKYKTKIRHFITLFLSSYFILVGTILDTRVTPCLWLSFRVSFFVVFHGVTELWLGQLTKER